MVKNEHEHVQNDFMNIFTFLAHFGWLFFYKKKEDPLLRDPPHFLPIMFDL